MIVLWIFLGALLLLLLQHVLYFKFWNRKLRMSLRFDQPSVTAGETVSVTELVSNRKLLPLPLFRYRYGLCRNFDQLFGPDGKQIYVSYKLALPAQRSVRNKTILKDLKRGIYTIADSSLEAQDLFYWGHFSEPFVSRARLIVYPKKISAEKLHLPYRQLLGAVLTRRYAQEDPFEIRNIRPYEPFDSMRDINWKASAKTGELKVNQHDYTTDEALLLILDAEHGTEEQRETVISLASSLAALFLHRGISVSVCANSRGCVSGGMALVPSGAGISHLRTIDEALSQIKLGASAPMSFSAFLSQLSLQGALRSCCTVISAGGSPEVSAAFDRLCGSEHGYYIQVGTDAFVPQGSQFTILPYSEREVII